MFTYDLSILAIPSKELKAIHQLHPFAFQKFISKWCDMMFIEQFDAPHWLKTVPLIIKATWLDDPYWKDILSTELTKAWEKILQRNSSHKHTFIFGLCEEFTWIREHLALFMQNHSDMIPIVQRSLAEHPRLNQWFFQNFSRTSHYHDSFYDLQQYCAEQQYTFEETRQFWLNKKQNMSHSLNGELDYFMSSKRSFDFNDSARQYIYHLQFCACSSVFMDKIPLEKQFNLWVNLLFYDHTCIDVTDEQLINAFIHAVPDFNQQDLFVQYKAIQNSSITTPLLRAMHNLHRGYQEAITLSNDSDDVKTYLQQSIHMNNVNEISLDGLFNHC